MTVLITCYTNRLILPLLLIAPALMLVPPEAIAQNWRIQIDRCRNVQVTQQTDVLTIETTGKDPQLIGDLVKVGSKHTILEFEYIAPNGVKNIELYLGPPFGPESRASLSPIPMSETWQTYTEEIPPDTARLLAERPQLLRLDLGREPGIRLQVKGLRLRQLTKEERDREAAQMQVMQKKSRQANGVQEYLKREFPYRINSVQVRRDMIILSGKPLPSSADASRLEVIEHPIWASIAEPEKSIETKVTIKSTASGWTAEIPRQGPAWDRLYSGWQLSWKGRPVTPRQFASVIDPLVDDFPAERPMPANQKGLGGIVGHGPMDDIAELGVTGITLNILLSRFVVEHPGPGRVLIEGSQPPVYFNSKAFAFYDPTFQWARKNNVIVSAILLVAPPNKASAFAPLVHPESDNGRFVMPDLTTRQGAVIYGCVLERLARRYRSHQRAPGGITNWIAHNEVDFHYVWTNMGIQPRELATETYYRSIRMMSAAARSYNPHARVFPSLTHHWSVPDDGQGKQLSPRDFLVDLQRYSVLDGDFPWGVAYHPYPQNLYAKTAWNDKKVTNDETTPLITIQNLEVLNQFMSNSKMRDSSRKTRSILLSEQGYHTDSYDAESQAMQAGSLFYAMKKIRTMPAIESFHYHRWIDHSNEGGLRMGLRTLPTEQNPFGVKKQSWQVYQAIGTRSERQATANLPGP